MECRNCNADNPKDAKFCRVCGNEISEVILKWVSVGDLKVKVRIRWWQMIILILLGCVLICSIVNFAIYFDDYQRFYSDPMFYNNPRIYTKPDGEFFYSFCFMIISLLLWLFSYRKFRNKKLSKFAAVMEESPDKNEVLIKVVEKYGLLDKQQRRITLPVIYDDIKVDPVTLDVLVVYEGETRKADIRGHVF